MSLVVWYPLQGDTLNRGTLGAELNPTASGVTYEVGILGQSLHRGSLVQTAAQAKKWIGNTVTIAMWVYIRPDGTWSNGAPFFCGSSGMTAPYNRKFSMFCYDGTTDGSAKTSLHCSWQHDESNDTYWGCAYKNFFELNKWVHLCIVQDAATETITVYRNGDEYSKTAVPGLASMKIAQIQDSVPFCPSVDYQQLCDIRIYDHALSQLEVKELSRALVLHHSFDSILDESTQNIYQGKTFEGWGSEWTMVPNTYAGNKVYKNKITNPNISNNAGFAYTSAFAYSQVQTTDPYVTLSFQKRLITPYSKALGGYIRIKYTDGAEAVHGWTYDNPDWATDASSVGKWEQVTAYAALSPGRTAQSITNMYVYADYATAGECEFACIQIEPKDHATPYTPTSRPSMINNETGLSQPVEKYNIRLSSDAASGEYSLNCHKTTWIKTLTSTGGQEQMTLAAWVNPRSYSGDCVVIGGCYLCVTNSGYLTTYCYGKNPEGYFTGSNTKIPLNTWTHIAVTWNTTHCIGYVNGNEEFKVTCTGTTSRGGNHDKKDVGSENSVGNRGFDGLIDDVRVYNTSLSAEEIYDLAHTKGYIANTGAIEVNYLDEQNENLINEKDFAIPANQTDGNGTLEMRNGVLSYGLQANTYYYGDAPLQNHGIFKGKFKEGKQYYFDLYMDVDTMYYTDGKFYVPGGFTVRYTDGTIDNVLATSTNGASGWQHVEYYSDPNKTIYGLGVYYYIGVKWFLRLDSGIYEVNKENAGVQQNYAMTATQFNETAFDGNALIHESGNVVGRSLIEE